MKTITKFESRHETATVKKIAEYVNQLVNYLLKNRFADIIIERFGNSEGVDLPPAVILQLNVDTCDYCLIKTDEDKVIAIFVKYNLLPQLHTYEQIDTTYLVRGATLTELCEAITDNVSNSGVSSQLVSAIQKYL